ncbi:hypothetical protein VP01_3167g5 [Puccinia sorghi]|uniref:RRM domain-containing protein n=1 Tax=Puccinia sorghi TaxID=27349 RepID=A0A0L6UYR4_9BASI|nr:hypothetical protein VP01_3167g5 [Puccinia sorghi]
MSREPSAIEQVEESHPEEDNSQLKTAKRKRKTATEADSLPKDGQSRLKSKRKRKNPELQKDTQTTASASALKNKGETIFTTTKRTKHGVWVGNLLFTTTAQELAKFLGAGPIVRLNMPAGKRQHEANTGFAYVDFATPEAVDAALDKSESLLGGRKLLIKRSSDYSGRPDLASTTTTSNPPQTLSKSVRKILDRQKQPPAPCLYFGNLGFETTSEGIVSMLHAHHQAQQVWNPKPATTPPSSLSKKQKSSDKDQDDDQDEDEDDGPVVSKTKPQTPLEEVGIRKVRMGTFAFVDFETIEQATKVLMNLKNHRLDGRNLTVEYASAEAVKRGGGSVRSMGLQKRDERRLTKTAPEWGGPKKPASSACRSRDPPNPPSTIIKDPHPPPPIIEELPRKPKKEFLGRQKPGAALANAQRAPIGIIKNPETIGKKTVFT